MKLCMCYTTHEFLTELERCGCDCHAARPAFLAPHSFLGNSAAMRYRDTVRLGLVEDDLTPLTLNWGYGQRVFTVAIALGWAERRAREELV